MGSDLLAKLIWIAIGIIFIVLVAVLAHMGFSSSNYAQSETQLNTVITNVQSLYANQPNFSGLTTANAISAGVFPSSMAAQGAATATDVYGGSVSVNTGTPDTEFTVEFDNVSQSDCIKLGSSINNSNLVSVSVDGQSPASITPGALASVCASSSNSIIWTLN